MEPNGCANLSKKGPVGRGTRGGPVAQIGRETEVRFVRRQRGTHSAGAGRRDRLDSTGVFELLNNHQAMHPVATTCPTLGVFATVTTRS